MFTGNINTVRVSPCNAHIDTKKYGLDEEVDGFAPRKSADKIFTLS